LITRTILGEEYRPFSSSLDTRRYTLCISTQMYWDNFRNMCVMWSVVPVAYLNAGHLWTVWTPANEDATKEVLVWELWYPRSRVQTRPKPSDFSGLKIHRMPSFRGEVKPSVPCRRFAACKRTLRFTWESELQAKLAGHFSPIIPSFTNRGLSCHLTWGACGDDGRN
jgi:hypothetical protein